VSREILYKLFKGLFITLSVATILAYFLTIFSLPFVPSFVVFVLAQFIFFYFYGEYVKRNDAKLQIDAQIRLAEMENEQTISVSCPCDRNIPHTLPIRFDRENTYTCQGCNKLIKVLIEAKTALATTPVEENFLSSPIFIDHVEKLLNKNGN